MIEVILFVQSGDAGPVRLVGCAGRSIKRMIEALQRGNPEILHIRLAVSGDARVERRLHTTIDGEYLARDWYRPAALEMIPATFLRYRYDEVSERQRIARLKLRELTKRP